MDYKKRDQYKKLISIIQGILILSILSSAYAYVWYKFYDARYENVGNFVNAGLLFVGVYVFGLFLFTKLNGGYKFGHLRLMDLIFSQILSVLGVNFLIYFVLCLVFREMISPAHMLILTVYDLGVILIYNGLMNLLEQWMYPPRHLMLVYGDKGPREMLDMFRARRDKFVIVESIHAGSDKATILKKATKHDGIIIHRVDAELRNELLRLCYENNIRAYILPNIADIIMWSCGDTHLFDTPMFVTRNHGITVVESFFKRIMDLVISLVMLIIFSPIMLICAILVKVYDRGPVIYKQERVTKDGKIFNILKFRSMRTDSETHAKLAGKHDDRITPVGRVLRSLHLDELPQLFNIIKGDMSIVGPRPERPEIIEKYKSEIPEFDYRLKVKAGLTGFAQVYGRYKTTSFNKLKMDIMYIEHYSIWLDIKLLFLTFKIIFVRSNSEGVDESDQRGQ